jgi:hypothetical protein
MKFLVLLKGKLLLSVAATILLAGGATAAFAATPTGQTAVQSLIHAYASVTADPTHGKQGAPHGTATPEKGSHACSGLPAAQKLVTSYHLSTNSKGNAVQALCALHQGTFKGTTTGGATVTVSRVYGYGEVAQLLTYAQYLAAHDSGNTSGKLTDTNVSSYLANALQSCGTTPLEKCLQTKIPGYQPGKSNKPTVTPTPKGNKPTVTPTPHH